MKGRRDWTDRGNKGGEQNERGNENEEEKKNRKKKNAVRNGE
jgi:hypothetical protein